MKMCLRILGFSTTFRFLKNMLILIVPVGSCWLYLVYCVPSVCGPIMQGSLCTFLIMICFERLKSEETHL